MVGSSKEPISEEVREGHPFESLNPPLVPKPNDTTFLLVRDPNFFNFIDPTKVNSLFGSSIITVVSQIETSTIEPTFLVEPNKDTVANFSYRRKISPKNECWDTQLSPRKEPPRYTLFQNQAYKERRGEN